MGKDRRYTLGFGGSRLEGVAVGASQGHELRALMGVKVPLALQGGDSSFTLDQ